MVNYLLYRLGQAIVLLVPLKPAYRIGIFFSDIHYLFADKDRKLIKENLCAIFPEKKDREIRAIRLKMVRNFAKYLVDFFRFEKIDKGFVEKNVKIVNRQHFDEALAKGKGVVIVTAHIGNWELGGVSMAILGYPISAVALPHKDKRVNRLFNFQRESKGLSVIPFGKAVRPCVRAFKDNRMVALVGDRDFSERGIVMDFFGKPTLFPEGPAAFALSTGATIVPGFMLRNNDDTFTLYVEKPIEFIATGDKKTDIKNIIGRYKLIFEDYIRRYPDQWYMFRRFWIE